VTAQTTPMPELGAPPATAHATPGTAVNGVAPQKRAPASHRRPPVRRFRVRRRIPMTPLTITGIVLIVLFIAFAVFVPIVGADPLAQSGSGTASPTLGHLFGTDALGRDVMARTAAGARLSLFVAVASVVLGVLIALPLGMLAGYLGGKYVDDAIMRAFEVIQALPLFVFALFVLGLSGSQPIHIGPITIGMGAKVVLLLGIAFMPYFARVARSATLVEVEEDYVGALQVVGVPRRRIILGEILVNVLPPVLVQAFLWVAIAIFAEAALGFLGLGIQPPTPTLGNVLFEGSSAALRGEWWQSVLPGLVMIAAMVGFNLLGDALNDSLNDTDAS